ncbi:hypothetical protein WH91_21145 [Devosia psychrophila]|nr:hypothetical protein WH91_21145 [Devosia psychrophila]
MHDDTFEPFKLWYGEVPGAYRQYVASQCRDDGRLKGLEEQLVKREAKSDEDDKKALKQLDALEHIRHLDHSEILLAAHAFPFDHNVRNFAISNVTVRVNPTNVLTAPRLGRTAFDVGVLKPRLMASRVLPEDEGRSFAAILHWFAEIELGHVGIAEPSLCVVSDVFARKLHFAPLKHKQIRRAIEANCQEIADRWPSFTPKSTSASRLTA